MLTFFDKKKDKTIDLPSCDLISHFRTLSSGTTLSLPSKHVNWSEVKTIVGMRKPPRNTGIGAVMTKPNTLSFLLETVWGDHDDNNQADGDMTLFTETSPEHFSFERMKIEDVQKRFPAWHGYHHGNKDYLRSK